jgi:tetratricopeptide (TPR) repeat protein
MIARLLLAAVSVALGAAMLVWLQASHAEDAANTVAHASRAQAGPAAIARGLRDARAARRLSPDVPALLLEAQILYRSGRRDAAARRLDAAVRQEPDNLGAWFLIGNTTRDRARFQQARAAVRRLNPQLAARGN